MIELAVSEMRGRCTIVAGVGSNDTRHAVHLTERATELGADALLSRQPLLQPAEPPRHRPPLRGGRARHRPCRSCSTTFRSARVPTCRTTCSPSWPSSTTSPRSSRPTRTNLAKVDGLQIYAGNDDLLADVLDLGEPGGILVASHLFGEEMHRMVDEPERRREIDAEPPGRLPRHRRRAAGVHDQGRAEPARHRRGRRHGCPTSSSTSRRRRQSARCSSATGCSRPPRRERPPPRPAARRPGRDRQEHDGRRVRRTGSSSSTPGCGSRPPTCSGSTSCSPISRYLRERADDIEAIVVTHGHEDHLGALPWVLRELGDRRADRVRRPPHGGDGPLQARRAQPARRRRSRMSSRASELDARPVHDRARST